MPAHTAAPGLDRPDKLDNDDSLLSAQPGTLHSRRTAFEVRCRRASDQDRVHRCEDSALAQRADDSSDVARGQEFV